MKTRSLITCLLLLLPGIFPLLAQDAAKPPASATAPATVQDSGPSPLEQKLRDGLYAEEAKQDLDAAAAAYRGIVENFDRDRETVSSALFRLGEVYRKQNRPKDAAECFRRVAREFPDRDPLARLARENLTALGEPLPQVPGAAAPGAADPEQEKALARLQELEKQSPDLLLNAQTSMAGNGYLSYDEALQAGYLRVVTWLLERGASPDRTPSDRTPLALAAEKGQTPLVELLIARKAVIDGPENQPSPLHFAAEKGHRAAAALLIKHGAAVDGGGGQKPAPLLAAVRAGNKSVTALLLEKGADANLHSGQALMEAVLKDDEATVKLLLGNKADPNTASRNLVHRQAQIPGLIQGNYSNTWDGLSEAVQNSIPKSFYAGFGIWQPGHTDKVSALHLACLRGQEGVIAALIASGADVNAKTELGSTPLEAACVNGNTGAMQLLIKAGAKADAVTPGDVRLIELALLKGDMALYEVLQKAGAKVSGASPCGLTPLEALSGTMTQTGKDEKFDKMFERLLEDGADPNGSGKFRPVLFVVENGKEHLIPALKKKGADFRPPGILSPVAVAMPRFVEYGDISVIKALIEAGADVNGVGPVPNPNGFSVPADRTQTALTALARSLPKPERLEAFLALKPNSDSALWALLDDLRGAREQIDYTLRNPSHSQNQPDRVTGRSTSVEDKKQDQEKRLKVAQRLWAYQRDEWNPERWSRPWVEALTADGEPALTTFCPAARAMGPVTVLEAMVYALGNASLDDKEGDAITARWNEGCADYSKLVIRRGDAKNHTIIKEEPVDLLAWLETGDASKLPVLQPGDVLAFISGGKANGNVPGEMPGTLRKAAAKLYDRDITLNTGDTKLALKLALPVAKSRTGFRQDPSSRTMAVEPTLSTLLTLLPKPSFFYRMQKVTLKRKDGTTQTVDASEPLSPTQDLALTGGDEILLEPVPLDDAALRARVAQGIFIGRESDGFLAEVLHAPSAPDVGGWSDDLKRDVLRHFCARSRFFLPWMDTAKLRIGPVLPGATTNAPWGQVLEVPRGPETVEAKPASDGIKRLEWAGPMDPANPEKPLISEAQPMLKLHIEIRGKGKAEHVFYCPNMVFEKTDEQWSVGFWGAWSASTTRSLPQVLSVMDAAQRYMKPPQVAQSLWEVRREGIEKPLAAFTPGKDEVPFLLLKDGDTLALDEVDMPMLHPPDVKREDGNRVLWSPGKLLPEGSSRNTPGLRVVTPQPIPSSATLVPAQSPPPTAQTPVPRGGQAAPVLPRPAE